MAGAGDAWQQAMGTLSGGLGRAGERQKQRLSNGALLPLANVGSDEEAAAALAAMKIDPNNITPEAMATIMGTRGRGMDMDTARMNNNNTGSQIGYRNTQADMLRTQDGRTQQTHDRNIQSEDDMYPLAGQFNDADINARGGNYGFGGNPMGQAGGQVQHGDTFNGFMGTVQKGGLTNPFGLAAVAATVQRESGFDPKNGNRTWSDPSESGVEGTSGGYMSLRDKRYTDMVAYTGGDMSPQAQASYFMQEDPDLIRRLEGAKSVEEAQQMMNEAWKFAGYNKPNEGEAAERFATANSMLSRFGGTSGGVAPGQTGTRQGTGEFAGKINIPKGAMITPAQVKAMNDDVFNAWDTGIDTRDANRTQEIAQQRAQIGWETELQGIDDGKAAQNLIDQGFGNAINDEERRAVIANSGLNAQAKDLAYGILEKPNTLAGNVPGVNSNPYSVPGMAEGQQVIDDFTAQMNSSVGSNETLRAQSQAQQNYGDTENPVDLGLQMKEVYGDKLYNDPGDIVDAVSSVTERLRADGVQITEADAKQLIADTMKGADTWIPAENIFGASKIEMDVEEAIKRGSRLYAPEAVQNASRIQGEAGRITSTMDALRSDFDTSMQRINVDGFGNKDYQMNGQSKDIGHAEQTWNKMMETVTDRNVPGMAPLSPQAAPSGDAAVDGSNRSASNPGAEGMMNLDLWAGPMSRSAGTTARPGGGSNAVAPGATAFDAAAQAQSAAVAAPRQAALEAAQNYIQQDETLLTKALQVKTPAEGAALKKEVADRIMADTRIELGMRYQMVNALPDLGQ
jgi:hypothetical protein